jgi:hypothetical protein
MMRKSSLSQEVPMRLRNVGFIVLGLLVSALAAPAFAAPKNPADYPLRVHIYRTHWSTGAEGPYIYEFYDTGFHGYGRANLFDGPETNAMEYTFECDTHFLKSDTDEAYLARWKKPDHVIEMLVSTIGSDKMKTCQLKVTLKNTVYYKHNGELISLTQERYKARQAEGAAREAAVSEVDADVSHYPMKLTLLTVDWSGTTNGMHHGAAQGNLIAGSDVLAVDMALACPATIHTTAEGRFYHARWIKQGSEMSILLHKAGDPTAAATCDVKASLHSDVYVLESAGVLKAVSQDKYKSLQVPEKTEQKDPLSE